MRWQGLISDVLSGGRGLLAGGGHDRGKGGLFLEDCFRLLAGGMGWIKQAAPTRLLLLLHNDLCSATISAVLLHCSAFLLPEGNHPP